MNTLFSKSLIKTTTIAKHATTREYLEGLVLAKSLAGMTGKGPISFRQIAQFEKAQTLTITEEMLKDFFGTCKFPKFPDGSPAYQVMKIF
jgi:hypothetical protein